jgi:hypothetical protein
MSHFKGFLTAKNKLVASISAFLSISPIITGKLSMNTVTISQQHNVIRAEDGVTLIVTEDGTHIGF